MSPRVRPPGRRPARLGATSAAFLALATAAVLPVATSTPAFAAPSASSAATTLSNPSSSADKPAEPAVKTPLGTSKPGKDVPKQHEGVVPGQVLVTLDANTSVTGQAVAGSRVAARLPQTSSSTLDAKLKALHATSLHPLLPSMSQSTTQALTGAARTQLGSQASDLSRTYVLSTKERDSSAVARSLQGVAGIASVEPDRYVNTMDTGAVPLPSASVKQAAKSTSSTAAAPSATAGTGNFGSGNSGSATDESPAVPRNYALSYSAQALLNAGGVNATGAFALLQGEYGQQPGTGETITNVSVGDLTDQSMADAGDGYVKGHGPTTILKDGKRYLDMPSMPLIPTYVAGPGGALSASASTENQDPSLGEVGLDFSVMAPLAHDQQRPDATGSGYTDLLGIAPGADYRLVVPQQPTLDEIPTALLAAANQTPRPDVITASLGYGTDSEGFPGRYLEDDPVVRSVVASIVQRDHIVVVISSNDGTRLYTPTSVGPDGGSTPTDVTSSASKATNINDDAESTTPSEVPDSGAIAAGGSTLDDTLASPADATGGAGTNATTAETRISGFGSFSSGFGTRVNVSAPSDNIVAFSHAQGGDAQAVTAALNGGTSASAPEIAAAAADVLQAAKLGGHHLDPEQVRNLLEETGRAVSTPAQIDRTLHVGPQVDVTAAVEKALGDKTKDGKTLQPAIVRLSVAHRTTIGGLGSDFTETTDPDYIDLGDVASGGNGEGLVGPVTIAGDITGLPSGSKPEYSLTVGSKTFRSDDPAIRLTPTQLLTAAGLPVTSTTDRTVDVTYKIGINGHTQATARHTLTFGPSDGRYVESTAPQAPAVVKSGDSVKVSYDLTGVTGLSHPHLVVSTDGHWNPGLAPIFDAAWNTELTDTTGTVTIPADAFDDGGGIYGIGIAQASFGGNPQYTSYGEFAPIRVEGGTTAGRPDAPELTGANGVKGHTAETTRAKPDFDLSYDVRGVSKAQYAEVEFSAPAPTNYGSLYTFTNTNGTNLDNDGVDAPSTAHKVLTSSHGTVRLNPQDLGLASSTAYDVRVLPLDTNHDVIGQASPVSTLAFDDGLAPDGSTVLSFAAVGDDSVAALRTINGGTEIRHYDTATGTYGAVITSDPGTNSDYEVLGTDATAHRALLVHQSTSGGDVTVETWNTATDALVGSTTLPASQYTFVVGRVDAVHGRGAVLLRSVADKTDLVLPVDLADGTTGTPIDADVDGVIAGTYSVLDFDTSTGDVYLAKGAGIICLGGVMVADVNLTTGTAKAAGNMGGCSGGFASDNKGTLYNLTASAGSLKIVPTSVLTGLNEKTGELGDSVKIRSGASYSLAVDGTNDIAVAAYTQAAGTAYFGSQRGTVLDNNSTAQLEIIDLKTGAPIRTESGFTIQSHGGTLTHGGAMNSLQIDPAARTGWIYGPGDTQIKQFSY